MQSNAHYYRDSKPQDLPGQVGSPGRQESDSELFVSRSSGEGHLRQTSIEKLQPDRRPSIGFQVRTVENQNKSRTASRDEKKSAKRSSSRPSKIQQEEDIDQAVQEEAGVARSRDDQKSAASSSGQKSESGGETPAAKEKLNVDWAKVNKGRRGQLLSRAEMLAGAHTKTKR